MDIKRVGAVIALLVSAVFLVACEGVNTDASDSTATNESTTTTGGGTTTTTTTTATVSLGSGSGTSFVPGQLALGLTSLAAGGQTSVTATLVDSNGSLYTTPVDVTFTSTCSGMGLASLTSPVTSSSGTAISTYLAKGCENLDTIKATATVNGTALSATADVTVQPAVVGSLAFVSATPTQIGLKGTGLVEASKVVFQVLDANGNPAPNKQVNFVLTNANSASLSSYSDTSTAEGLVSTTVNAGTVPETVRVQATYATDPTIQTLSDGLVIATGLVDNDGISVAAKTLNVEAWELLGVEVEITAYASDINSHPVADGTAILFKTEGGMMVQGSCETVDGQCSVMWRSTDTRPADGRSTITATMVGIESFVDNDKDGTYSDGDTFTDIPEAFQDYNENGVWDDGSDPAAPFEDYYDYDGLGSYSPADGKYNGPLCTHSTDCSPNQPGVHVRDEVVIVLSGSDADITVSPSTIAAPYAGIITIQDFRGQPMPAGTTVSIGTTNGKLTSQTSYTIGSTTSPTQIFLGIDSDGTSSSDGKLTVKVSTPVNKRDTIYQATVTD